MKGRLVFALVVGAVALVGCGRERSAKQQPGPGGEKYLLDKEPAGAKGVIAVRKASKDGDDVVVVGRIGGDKDQSLIKGRAAFTIVDPSLIPCNEREDDQCETPWDYCCDTPETIRGASAFVKFVGENGETVPTGARELFGVKELQTVVVRGQAKRDDKGNLTILARDMHVRPAKGTDKGK
jgi:hypothetical protein